MHLSSWVILTRILPPPYLPGLKCGALSPCMCPLLPSAPLLSPVIHSVTSQGTAPASPLSPNQAQPCSELMTTPLRRWSPLWLALRASAPRRAHMEGNCSAYPLASLSGVASRLLSSTSLPGPAAGTIFEDVPVRWDNSAPVAESWPQLPVEECQSQAPRPSELPCRQTAKGPQRKTQGRCHHRQ